MANSLVQNVTDQRLTVLRQRLVESVSQESALQRQLKGLKRKDYGQQIQPLYAQVSFEGGATNRRGQSSGAWRKPLTGWPTKPPPAPVTKPRGVTQGTTGSMTALSGPPIWTTEGYVEAGPPPPSTANERVYEASGIRAQQNKLRQKFQKYMEQKFQSHVDLNKQGLSYPGVSGR